MHSRGGEVRPFLHNHFGVIEFGRFDSNYYRAPSDHGFFGMEPAFQAIIVGAAGAVLRAIAELYNVLSILDAAEFENLI